MRQMIHLKRDIAHAAARCSHDQLMVRQCYRDLCRSALRPLRRRSALGWSFAAGLCTGVIVPTSRLVRTSSRSAVTKLVRLSLNSFLFPLLAAAIGGVFRRPKST